MILPGDPLRESELATLTGIPAQVAIHAYLRSVDSVTGRQLVGRNGSGDYSGIAIPHFWPGESDRIREWWLRLKNPPLEYKNGILKPAMRYLGPPGRSPMLYFPPDTDPAWLSDTTMPYIITEGAKKTLALYGLSIYGLSDTVDRPRWLPIGLAGIWSWRGKRGRTEDGQDIKGVIADFDRIVWRGRMVIVIFDVNVHVNPKVLWARHRLADELRERGAVVAFVDLPADLPATINGVDDLTDAWGPDRVIELINTKAYDPTTISKPVILTEIGNAERLVDAYGDDLRFCHQTSQWFVWDDQRFAPDQIATVERYAKTTVRKLYADALNIVDKEQREAQIKFAMRSDSDHGVRALLSRAAAEEGVPILLNDLDADQWILNVENGTLNLRTGELRPHSRDDLISKLAPVRFDPTATCPRWMKFLSEVFEPHPDAPAYLQRAVGYSLTGDIREECLFLMYGSGGNGKGTIIRTFLSMLGDYAGTADFSTFIAATRDDRSPRDDVANMRGKRLVTSQEAREGAPLAEALVKWLTGGDVVRARNLYERSTEWLPTHHLWLAVNRKPIVRGTDAGIWRRLRLIPFDVNFEGREDKTLKQALLGELSGILNWCLSGCLEWQRDGLGMCESVETATQSYRVESDQIGRFIEDECGTLPTMQVGARKLYTGYRNWAERGGESTMTETNFGTSLSERGFGKEHKSTGWVYLGLGLRVKL